MLRFFISPTSRLKFLKSLVKPNFETEMGTYFQNAGSFFRKNISLVIAWFVFLVLTILEIRHHEPWFDEIQQWLIVQASHSIPDLIYQKRYEGHPALWYILLYGIKVLFNKFEYIWVLHFLISSANAALLLFALPFRKWQRILLVFGYFFLFEYNIIARSYAIGILLFFIFILLYSKGRRPYILYGLLFTLMANSNAYSAQLAVFCSFFLLYDIIEKKLRLTPAFIGGAVIFLAGLAFAAYTMITPPDGAYDHDPQLYFNIGGMANTTGFLGLMFFPNMMYLRSESYLLLLFAVSTSLWILWVTFRAMREEKGLFIIFLSGNVFFLIFTYFTTLHSFRHCGHMLIWWIGCMWLLQARRGTTKLASGANLMFSASLIFSLFFSAKLYWMDWTMTYTKSVDAAKFIKENKLQDAIIVSRPEFIAYPVAFWLNKEVFSLSQYEYMKFPIFNKANYYHKYHAEADMKSLIRLRASTDKRIVLLLRIRPEDEKPPIPRVIPGKLRLDSIAAFHEHILGGEFYNLYLVNKDLTLSSH
jgi:hypothetical protein